MKDPPLPPPPLQSNHRRNKTLPHILINVRKDKKFNSNIPPSMYPLGDTPCLAYLLQYSPPYRAQIPAYFFKYPLISSSLQSTSSPIFCLFTFFFAWSSFLSFLWGFLTYSFVFNLLCPLFPIYCEVYLQFLQFFSFLKLKYFSHLHHAMFPCISCARIQNGS
jgi:hypothetical protein